MNMIRLKKMAKMNLFHNYKYIILVFNIIIYIKYFKVFINMGIGDWGCLMDAKI